eukprot:CAMPEP_0185197706 /NCGR_PEP_ID=MMETSP1140-20130426/41089_1 /TAXON_ID=298111 /ORGANISM="Pavlova sp., Strain CCMP459" /LENGTH=189 /DNA_ID=CAMNT_0027764845 /DNA_START=167 /DNA_END=734 /DNA_ORIENTATION=-
MTPSALQQRELVIPDDENRDMAACSMMMRRDDERMRAQPPDDDDHEHDASCWMSLSDLVEDATTNEGDRCACGLLGTASSAAARVRATGSAASEGAREGASEAGQVLLEPTEALREARRDAPALAPGVAPFGASAAAAACPAAEGPPDELARSASSSSPCSCRSDWTTSLSSVSVSSLALRWRAVSASA